MRIKNINTEALKHLKPNATFSDDKIWNNTLDKLFPKYQLENLKTLKSLAKVIWGETIKLNKMEEDIDDILLQMRINHTLTSNIKHAINSFTHGYLKGDKVSETRVNNHLMALDSLEKDNMAISTRYEYYWINPLLSNPAIEKKVADFYNNKISATESMATEESVKSLNLKANNSNSALSKLFK